MSTLFNNGSSCILNEGYLTLKCGSDENSKTFYLEEKSDSSSNYYYYEGTTQGQWVKLKENYKPTSNDKIFYVKNYFDPKPRHPFEKKDAPRVGPYQKKNPAIITKKNSPRVYTPQGKKKKKGGETKRNKDKRG